LGDTGSDCAEAFLKDNGDFCKDRRNIDDAFRCVLRHCTYGPYVEETDYHITANVDQSWIEATAPDSYYTVRFLSNDRERLENIIEGLLRDNTGAPARFTRTGTFDETYLDFGLGAFATDAGQFARELVTAQWNMATTLFFDGTDTGALFDQLLFTTGLDIEGCTATVPPWLDKTAPLRSVIEFARFFIGLGNNVRIDDARDQCSRLLDVAGSPLCSYLGTLSAPDYDDPATKENLSSALTRVLREYNRAFANCDGVFSTCIALGAPRPPEREQTA
jgi:hypothetical protein